MQKQARQLNIESNSKRFLDAVRCFWMPRLIQKVEQTSYSSSLATQLDSQTHSVASLSPNPTVSSSSNSCPAQSKLAHYSNLCTENSRSVTSPCVFTTDSMTISQQPEILENPTCPPVLVDNVYSNLFLSDIHCVENSTGYDMDGFNLASMAEMGTFDNSPSECQMGEGNWVFDDMADATWSMDDIWQHRELGEMHI